MRSDWEKGGETLTGANAGRMVVLKLSLKNTSKVRWLRG